MNDRECVALLQWALPRMSLRWDGFRNVRGQVCKRIARRSAELGLGGIAAYRPYLEAHAEEWPILESLCRVTISRFFRDRGVFDRLRLEILPELAALAVARAGGALRAWSAGCASGEEPYTLAIVWQLELAERFPGVALEIVATDSSEQMLERARAGRYDAGTLRELPEALRSRAFEPVEGQERLRNELRRCVDFRCQDLRRELPGGDFHLVLCRNLAFTYFDEAQQREVAARIASRMVGGGVLVLGAHERLPGGVDEVVRVQGTAPIYRRAGVG